MDFDIAMLRLRVGVGAIFVTHGMQKQATDGEDATPSASEETD